MQPRPVLTIIKAKGLFKWFKCDQFMLEYGYVTLSGDWNENILTGMLLAGDRPIMIEK